MHLFNVKIESTNYNLHFNALILHHSKIGAEQMAGDQFHASVNAFYSASTLRRGPAKQVDKGQLLERAVYTTVEHSEPQIINSAWDLKSK